MRFQGVVAMVLVQDIEPAVRFYTEILGFTVQDEQEEWVIFNEGVGLQVTPEPLPDVSLGLNTILLTLVVESVQSVFTELTQKGVPFFLPPTTEGGITIATFRDMEGNLIQLMQLGSL